MSDLKQVKVDNWGIYFLQRLKHFFNRTDYCDLTLQFQDNAQLKVHRLVLSACTEYFELLERTCEMYEDCLVMPDDLQADVVVPIVNFMYTGQLEFKVELLEKLYQTSEIMNMPVLSKLLDAQRQQVQVIKPPPIHSYGGIKQYAKGATSKQKAPVPSTSSSKRSFSKAFESEVVREKQSIRHASTSNSNNGGYLAPSPMHVENHYPVKKSLAKGEPRPTRYELPEELDTDNIYESSFTDISYTSAPLMVHPETTKRYSSKRGQYNAPSSSKRFSQGPSTVEIVECRKVSKEENLYEEDSMLDDTDMFGRDLLAPEPVHKNTNQLFDQILDTNTGPKVTIEAKNSKQASKLDHAKIISEVLKKYPHLVKSNKNIKLKLLDTPNSKPTKKRPITPQSLPKEEVKIKSEPDYTYETEVLDSVKAAKLIAMGADNVNGPWICLICGTPGRALHFTSYYKFRRHLVEVHNEKPVSNMCEYCGLKSMKRNYLLHHQYTKHGKKPPPQYHFPKCNLCNYVALNEGFLVKHKISHAETKNFRCNVCAAAFNSSSMLLMHIQNTGHKYSAEKKTNLQCVYCLKVFLRESNLYAHLKTNHKLEAKTDCIIDDSDEERQEEEPIRRVDRKPYKFEIPVSYDQESDEEVPYINPHKPVVTEKPRRHRVVTSTPRQKILNSGFSAPIPTTSPAQPPQKKPNPQPIHNQYLKDESMELSNSGQDEIIMIGDTEYIMRDNQLIPKNSKILENDQYILSDMMHPDVDQTLNTLTADSTLEFSNIHHQDISEPDIKLNKKPVMNQPIQIVVSNEDEYKALMSSNHSIIFDDSDTNKRLTVLAGPHESTLDGTTIDLDNTQSNEMMIIQDDYPLNVSEAVSADNSNIVVVYSHPVGDQTKPYQLITSQALGGAQFVSTSAVLTRNYNAVTTSAAIVNTQIMDHGNWHDNIGHNIDSQQIQVPQESDLQVLTNVEEVVMAPTENEIQDKLEELPEVHMLPVVQKDDIPQEPQIEHMEETLIQHNDHVDIPAVENTVEEVRDAPTMPIEEQQTSVPVQSIEDMDTITMESEEPAAITLQAENNDATVQMQTQEQVSAEGEEKYDEILEEPEVEEETTKNVTASETEDLQNQKFTQPEEEMRVQEPVEDNAHSFAPSKEQIQNLTSEWSEDDDEIAHERENILIDNIEKPSDVENAENNSVELEESIENIQQEMEKQMTQIVAIEAIEECGSPIQEEMNTAQELHENSPDDAVPPCPEKISSLLNDWDENDSQEGNGNENAEGTLETADNTEDGENGASAEADEASVEKDVPKKDDKIKSLVSDWDDEEEEGNKE
ncbi:hypothetical protein MSG28_012246 [Choristoneura fumiferana]|uniref:Uncharacterized protein n=1 Tax=Choristoneura fumiferana TaxID=7141 RepID=A0ACC0KDF3_CHOFU|nr:hypothetical protein MSG28_012246 [Choristoneura fumiferana]